MRVVIVDDEPLARSRLNRLLANLAGIEIVGVYDNGRQAVEQVSQKPPDIVFLDIQMPVMNGLQAAKLIIERCKVQPAIVFCTAFDEYALEAFDVKAASYLLKPVMEEDLRRAVENARSLNQLQIRALNQTSSDPSIKIQHQDYIEKKSLHEIFYFRSTVKQVVAGAIDGKEQVVGYSLKELEALTCGYFVRVHRSSLVNVRYFESLTRDHEGGYNLKLSNCDMAFKVSRRSLSSVKQHFN